MSESFLSTDEVDTLLKGVKDSPTASDTAAHAGPDPASVQPYDLTSQERITRQRLAGFDIINEKFVRLFRAGMHSYIHRNVELVPSPVRFVKYRDFTETIPQPPSLNLVEAAPLRGTGMIVLAPQLVSLIVDNLFGGDGRFPSRTDVREFTRTEQRIITRLLAIICDTYSKAWEPVCAARFNHVRSENNLQLVKIAAPDDLMLVITYTVRLGQLSGDLHVCLPYSMIDPVKAAFLARPEEEPAALDKRWTQMMTQQLQSAEVELVVNLGQCTLPLKEIMQMQAGDIIPIKLDAVVTGFVDSIPVMECTYGQVNRQYAVRVERLLRISGQSPQGETK